MPRLIGKCDFRCGSKIDTNCRAGDVRSLAEADPDRQVFAKFKHLLRKPARCSARKILRAFVPTECAAISEIQPKPIPKASCLVFVRLAHDRRFVGAVLLFVLFVLFVFIRISGRHRVAHDREGTPVDTLGRKLLGDVWGHVDASRVISFNLCWMKSQIIAMVLSASGIAGKLQSVRAEPGAEGLPMIPLARIPDRFS